MLFHKGVLPELMRYEAIFGLLNELNPVSDVGQIGMVLVSQLKYVADIFSWQYLHYDQSLTPLDHSPDNLLVVEGFQGKATHHYIALDDLPVFGQTLWKAKQVTFLDPEQIFQFRENLPLCFHKKDIAQIYACPHFQEQDMLGLFVASKRQEAFSQLDIKFIQLISRFVARKIGHIETEKLLSREIVDSLATITQQNANLEEQKAELAQMLDSQHITQRSLIKEREKAESANKAKSQFLANMSHELRTPLNAIIGFTELMQSDSRLDDDLQDYLDIVNQSGDHLLALINDILDIARVEAGKIERNDSNIELASFLRAIIAMLSVPAQSKDLLLLLEQNNTLPEFICTDELKLRQILINLIGNAIKFTEQGQITVKVGYLPAAQGSDSKEQLQFEVHDTGSGMTEDEQTSLFQAFSQTESGRKAEGTGLGLAISQRFVELLGGEIEVQSTPGQGSVFRFSIAISLVSEGEVTEQVRHVEGLAPGQPLYRILVVEDTEFSRILLVNLLERLGFNVQFAVNGQQAIDLFTSWQPDLIWMDILMPVMDGREATKHIRQLPGGDTLPIIAITASSTLEDKDNLLASGFDDVVYKPFRGSKIIGCIEAQLGAKFIDEQPAVIETSAQAIEKLDEEQLRAIPHETREAIRKAAIEGDIEQLQQLITALPDSLAELKTTLMSLADSFEFEILLEGLTGAVPN